MTIELNDYEKEQIEEWKGKNARCEKHNGFQIKLNVYGDYDEDEEDFLTDISGYFQHIKEELPSSTISKWEVGDKLVIKVTNFLEQEDDPIENGENYYIVLEPNTPEQQEEE